MKWVLNCNLVVTPPPSVTDEEISGAVKKMEQTAPGPDGVPGRIHARAMNMLGDNFKKLFNACLLRGKFQAIWRTVSLVPKPGKRGLGSSSFKPICLLSKAGKI